VAEDIEAVLRKIEYWHQGLIAAFKTTCRNEHGVWDGVRWDVRTVAFNALEDEDEKREMPPSRLQQVIRPGKILHPALVCVRFSV
jgi:hypothetical protein